MSIIHKMRLRDAIDRERRGLSERLESRERGSERILDDGGDPGSELRGV